MPFTKQQLKDIFDLARQANDALGTAASKMSDIADYHDTESELDEWESRANEIDAIAWKVWDLSNVIAGVADDRDWLEEADGDRIGDRDWNYIQEQAGQLGIDVELTLIEDEG